ncbi:MAG: type II secretion system F family protein, partial [Bacillota bacterium]
MPLYRYRVRNREGLSFEGSIEAASETEAVAHLRGQSFIITNLELDKDILSNVRHGSKGWGRVSLKDLAIFSRQLATLINAGVAILVSLRVLQQQTASAKLRRALTEVCNELEGGATFASALQKHPKVFPEIMVNTISAGEIGGALDQVLERVADHFEKEHEMSQKFKTAMFYPSFVLTVAVGVIIFLLVVVLPNFVTMFDSMGMELPTPTRILLGIGTGFRKFWYLILADMVVAGFSFRVWSRTDPGHHLLDQMALNIPIFGPIIRGRAVSRFART